MMMKPVDILIEKAQRVYEDYNIAILTIVI